MSSRQRKAVADMEEMRVDGARGGEVDEVGAAGEEQVEMGMG